MPRTGFTPSSLPAGAYVVATCRACGGHRYVTRALMLEKAGDRPLQEIEPRLRCIERRQGPRGPACGGPMTIELASVGAPPPEANAAPAAMADTLADFAVRMGAGPRRL